MPNGVEAAVLSRGRRSTAGQRMGALVGEAINNDDAFWGHSTWMEDEDKRNVKKGDDDDSSEASSADGSFDLQDEPEENRVDVFDSDFNESESEESCGSDNERVIVQEEKSSKRAAAKRKSVKLSAFSKKRKSVGGSKTRIMGSEHNTGLVLKFPISNDAGDASVPPMTMTVNNTIIPDTQGRKFPLGVKATAPPISTLVSTRSRRIKGYGRKAINASTNADTSSKKKTTRRKFTQEELLIESVRETEPANERWLLGRRRTEAMSDMDDKKKAMRGGRDFKVVMKYHSLKGCYNTLTFPDMDHVPAMFQRRVESEATCKKYNSECIITGRKARYRDPLTTESYYDLEAFRELRRRHHAGLPLDAPLEQHSLESDPSEARSQSSHGRSDSSLPRKEDDDDALSAPESHSYSDTSSHSSPAHDTFCDNATAEYTTNTCLSTMDDIGDSNDIDIDTLFPNEPPPNILQQSNGITSAPYLSNADIHNPKDLITSIVTPPQIHRSDFVQHHSSKSEASKPIPGVDNSRSVELDQNSASSSTSSNSHVSSTQQVIIAS